MLDNKKYYLSNFNKKIQYKICSYLNNNPDEFRKLLNNNQLEITPKIWKIINQNKNKIDGTLI